MSYSLVDSKQNVQHLASIMGMADLLHFVQRMHTQGPLLDFFEEGESDDVPGVLKDIERYLPYCTAVDVRATLVALKEALLKSKGFVIIVD